MSRYSKAIKTKEWETRQKEWDTKKLSDKESDRFKSSFDSTSTYSSIDNCYSCGSNSNDLFTCWFRSWIIICNS